MKHIKIDVPEGKTAQWINGVLTLVDEQDNRPVTERVKTLEDAIKELGEDNTLVQQYRRVCSNALTMDMVDDILSKDLVAYLKLRIIAAALNEGWEPQFTTEEYRYYPWYYLYTEEELEDKSDVWKKERALVLWGGDAGGGAYCGLAYASSFDAFSDSSAALGARLAVKSDELAIYFGKQFIEIWKDYCVIINAENNEED